MNAGNNQQPRGRATRLLFSKGIGLGFNTFITAAEPEASLLAGIKPSPRINLEQEDTR
jgi:hypothetical protein